MSSATMSASALTSAFGRVSLGDARARGKNIRRPARGVAIVVRAEDENSGAEGGGEAPARAPAVAVAVVAAVAASAAAGKTMECRNPSCKFLA